jgi:hypothetical protein
MREIMKVIAPSDINRREKVTRTYGTDLTFQAAGSGRWTIHRAKPLQDPPRAAKDRLGRHLERWYEENHPGRKATYWFDPSAKTQCELVALGAHIERRRSKPDCPAGWYYVGPDAPDGERAGGYIEDAVRLAADRLV